MFGTSLRIAALLIVAFSEVAAARGEEPLDPAATREYAVAVGLQSKKLYTQAAERWRKYVEAYPKDPRIAEAWHHFGVCLMQEKKYADAAAVFRAGLERFPKFESLDATNYNLGLALYNVGRESEKAKDYRDAAKAFAELVVRFPKSVHVGTARYYEAESRYFAGDVKEAIAVYRQVIDQRPNLAMLPDVYYALGTAQQETGQQADAAATFAEFLKKYPEHAFAPEMRLRQGQALAALKRYAEAAPLFQKASEAADAEFADYATLQQGECLHQSGQFAKAAAAFERHAARFPKSPYREAAGLALGKAWFEAGNLDKARAAFQAVIAAKGEKAPTAAYLLGQSLLKEGRAKDAAQVFEKAVAEFPKSESLPQLRYALLRANYEQPSLRKKTAAGFAEFAAKNPDHELAPRSLYMAALCAMQTGDFDAARRHSEQFLVESRYARNELRPDVLFVAAESHLQDASMAPGNPPSRSRN